MKKIALMVMVIYSLLLLTLTLPVVFLFVHSDNFSSVISGVFSYAGYWIFLFVFIIAQGVMLVVPVKIENKRPITKKIIFLPVIVTGFLIAMLFFGSICSLYEFIFYNPGFNNNFELFFVLTACGLIWLWWSLFFSGRLNDFLPNNIVLTQCDKLMKSSVMMLLIAVPVHIIARNRDYCCAGFFTFIGITFGIAVMLFSFGPGVFFLYADRWKKLHPEKK
ncbi:MAG: hypothetical protein PHP69_04830 [Candidatus Omnitrophica bacterium]|nr:hypothetical protein [Candidatus Omnitrophota bacterium]MDD5080395.1 hypothetical protein [Candidatus Omnitrophota bacterium]MDD5440719.1 hypothetical protein [Candidatus Omnitrophota bacterium]